MSTSLWSANTPAHFWQCQPEISEKEWQKAIWSSVIILELADRPDSLDSLLALVWAKGNSVPLTGNSAWQDVCTMGSNPFCRALSPVFCGGFMAPQREAAIALVGRSRTGMLASSGKSCGSSSSSLGSNPWATIPFGQLDNGSRS